MAVPNSFIITLTGPSACGKGVVSQAMIEYGRVLRKSGIDFRPFVFKKDVTRSYRINEWRAILANKKKLNRATSSIWEIAKRTKGIDVISNQNIPERDDLVYRTYGDEYGLCSEDLTKALDAGKSPIVVINDVRVVEELKRKYKGRVLSLFIFRHIVPDVNQQEQASAQRGGVSKDKTLSRFEKAVALYRVYIENIHIFDRVVLNVQGMDLAKLQAKQLIKGVFEGKISLDKKIIKSPKLFIVSGNAASGKDDIIKAALAYGKNQTDILVKSTTRQVESNDIGEIECKYVPKDVIVKEYEKQYEQEYAEVLDKYAAISLNPKAKKHYFLEHKEEWLNDYNELKKNAKKEVLEYSFEEFCDIQLMLNQQKEFYSIKTASQRFWDALKEAQQKLSNSNGDLSKKAYYIILNKWFMLNKSKQYIPIDDIRSETENQREAGIAQIEDKKEHYSWLLDYKKKKYIFYENNDLYGEPIKYGYEIGRYVDQWKNHTRNKHLVLTVSLPNMFRLCREQFGSENVITSFAFSSISREEHTEHSDAATGKAKLKEYNDIKRYAEHIADFDYALIYAETSLTNRKGNQKDELVDQMFRLFRVYNKEE